MLARKFIAALFIVGFSKTILQSFCSIGNCEHFISTLCVQISIEQINCVTGTGECVTSVSRLFFTFRWLNHMNGRRHKHPAHHQLKCKWSFYRLDVWSAHLMSMQIYFARPKILRKRQTGGQLLNPLSLSNMCVFCTSFISGDWNCSRNESWLD